MVHVGGFYPNDGTFQKGMERSNNHGGLLIWSCFFRAWIEWVQTLYTKLFASRMQFCIGGFKAVEIENLCPESSTKLFEKKHVETNQLQL